jgi:hypothetical protein
VRFFGFYFWIGVLEYKQPKPKPKPKAKDYSNIGFIKNNRSTLPRIG